MKFELKGVATLEEIVETIIEGDDITREEVEDLATREVLQTHPDYESVEWVSVTNAD